MNLVISLLVTFTVWENLAVVFKAFKSVIFFIFCVLLSPVILASKIYQVII